MKTPAIPYYYEINEFLESISPEYRTDDPLLYCLRLKESDQTIHNYKPPFRKAFYFIALIADAGKTRITYDTTNVTHLNSFLVFQSPGLLYSFSRDDTARGYLIYFKPECFSFFRPEFEREFPFFDILHTHFFKLNASRFEDFATPFEELFSAYETTTAGRHPVAAAKLLALLYQLKEFTTSFNQWEQGFTTPQQILLRKFIQLINNFYLEKRTIEEYASLLHVTANHLSQAVKLTSGKNALSFINERIVTEAKSLIRYTDHDVAQIAWQLNFSDPANFGKFFKKHTGQTPLEFRRQNP